MMTQNIMPGPNIEGAGTSPLSFRISTPGQFRVVGIGVSAGGFETLSQFVGNVPENCDMASDRTVGLRSIKENAGLSLVQDPAFAKFAKIASIRVEGLVIILSDVTISKSLEFVLN
jgi:hypothetical protein